MRNTQRRLGVALFLVLSTSPAWAQASDQASLEQEIQALKARLEQLEQRVKVSGRKQEIKAEESAAAAKDGASVTADSTGFRIKSNDGNFTLKIGADLQSDVRTFTGDGNAGLTDQILLRRVRPTFSGTVYKYIDYYIRPDFGQGTTIIYDAYIQMNYFSRANLRIGKFKPPVGLERLQSDDDTSFIERGLPTLLAPSRDIGFQLSGDILKQRVAYQIGVFNGVPDNSLSDASPSSHRDCAGRIFLTPFQRDETSVLKGLGLGIGASGGSVDGVALPSYKTVGQTSFLPLASGVTSTGHRTRLAPQAYYYVGPFGLLAEYTLSEEGFQKGNLRRAIAFRAYQVEASYILTGERKSFTSPAPKKAFDPLHHGWGAIELAIRVGDFSADKGLFAYGFASTSTAPRHDHEWVGGVNWYLNRMARMSLDYGDSEFGGGAPAGANRLPEGVILARFQLNFI